MKSEIGGYIELENGAGNEGELYHDLLKINSARNAFACVLRKVRPSKVYLPYYLCSCIQETCKSEGIDVEYYHIDSDMVPILPKILGKNELLYIVNYYGQIKKRIIESLKSKFSYIVLDNVQAFFSRPIRGVFTIYSCRKFFGVPDGGYVSNINTSSFNLNQDSSKERFKHLIGRLNSNAQIFYKEFLKNEQIIDHLPVLKMSRDTEGIMNTIEYKKIKKIREQNFDFLNKRLKKLNSLKLRNCCGPYCYPLLMPKGSMLRDILISNKIYVPHLWPNIKKADLFEIEKNLVDNLVVLPCDQRYSLDEMKYICDMIFRYAKE